MWTGEPRQCPLWYLSVCNYQNTFLSMRCVWYVSCLVFKIISKSFATVTTSSSWLLGWQMGYRMGPRRRNLVLSFGGYQNGVKEMATGIRENTFNDNRKLSSSDPQITICKWNIGECFGVLPEWGFESIYLDPKGMGNPRGYLDYTTDTQPSTFLERTMWCLLKPENRQWHNCFVKVHLSISACAVNLFADLKTAWWNFLPVKPTIAHNERLYMH